MKILKTELSNNNTIEQDLLNILDSATSLEVLIVSNQLAVPDRDNIIIKDSELLDRAQRLLDRYISQGLVSASRPRAVGQPGELVFYGVAITESGKQYLEKLNHPYKCFFKRGITILLTGNGLIAAASSGLGGFFGAWLIKHFS